MTTSIDLIRSPRFVGDDLDLLFGGGQDATLQWDTAETNDALKLGLKLNSAAQSGNFILVNKDHVSRNTGLGATADPRLAVWSGDDPAAGGASEYVSIVHDRTNGIIATGAGDLKLNPAGHVVPSGTDTKDLGSASARFRQGHFGEFLAAGGQVATSGEWRMTTFGSMLARNVANSGNVAMLGHASGDYVIIGGAGANEVHLKVGATVVGQWTGGSLTLPDAYNLAVGGGTGTKIGTAPTQKLGFFNATPVVQPTVTGSRGGNVALASLLTQLASLGLIVDSTTT